MADFKMPAPLRKQHSVPLHASQNPEAVAEGNADFQDLADHGESKHDSVLDPNRFTMAKKLIVCCDGKIQRLIAGRCRILMIGRYMDGRR